MMSLDELKKREFDIRCELARRHLMDYTCLYNPLYRRAPHNELIARALDDVVEGKCKRLMIFAPPRHGKSYLTSESFPAYYLGRYPNRYIIHSTYSDELARDFGNKIKNQLKDELHGTIFKRCNISGRSASQSKITTTLGGAYFAVGAGGAITGRGAHLLIIDDPIKGREEADSETMRRKLKEWFNSVAYTRLMPQGSIVIIQTRWHYDDLSGWLLDEELKDPYRKNKWRVINLKAICEDDNDPLGRKIGEALWPSDFPVEDLLEKRNQMGTREFSSLYQGSPSNDESAIIRVDWFNRYYDLPPDIRLKIHSWDTAIKDDEVHDPTCMHTWCLTDNGYYLTDRFSDRLQFPDLVRTVINYYERDKPDVVLIEDKGSGQQLIQVLQSTTRLPVKAIRPKDSKVFRVQAVSGTIESGKVYLPYTASWLADVERQFAQFPSGAHDDDVDAMSQALSYLIQQRGVSESIKKQVKIHSIYSM